MFTNRYVANIILIGLVLLSVVFAFYDSVDKLALTWLNSNTYGHGFLILPIVLWLVDRKAYLLKDITAQPSRIAIIFVGLFSFLWFISVLMYVNVIEQFVLFTLLIVLTCAFFGWKIVNAIKFPLFFLYFSIPIGDFLIPYLQY